MNESRGLAPRWSGSIPLILRLDSGSQVWEFDGCGDVSRSLEGGSREHFTNEQCHNALVLYCCRDGRKL